VDGNGSIGTGDRCSWQRALQYCEGLSLAGHTDWRLPNLRELYSIVDYGKLHPDESIDPVFGTTIGGNYWSSTSHGEVDAPRLDGPVHLRRHLWL
jgi:hypothetical protein